MRGFLRIGGMMVLITCLCGALMLTACQPAKAPDKNGNPDTGDASAPPITGKIKAGFIYVGPVGDFGWSHAHEQSRQHVMKLFPWMESTYVESVAEADAPRVIDRLVQEEHCDIVFTTSFGYMDSTIEAGKEYPNTLFMHCSGYKQAPNVGTYFAELYQMYYLNGLMAGALTKSKKVGYVGAHPIPEVVRHINAFGLGLREVNPDARVTVKWLFAWYDPAKARDATEALIAEGCDVIAFTQDSPAICEVCQEYAARGKQVLTFGHYSPMQRFGQDAVVSGQLVDWNGLYEEILMRVHTKTWTNRDYWWLAKERATLLGGEPDVPINPKFVEPLKAVTVKDPILGPISVHDLALKRLDQMREPTVLFDPFTGPIKDQSGTLRLKPAERASMSMLLSMDWFLDNIDGTIPKN